MNDDELMRRISDAIDAQGGLEANEDLGALLADDPEARAYAADLEAIGEALAARGTALLAAEPREESDWDALAARIDRALAGDGAGADDYDATAPPDLDDAAPEQTGSDGWGDVSGPRAKGAADPRVEATDGEAGHAAGSGVASASASARGSAGASAGASSAARDPEPRVELAAPARAHGVLAREAEVIDLAALIDLGARRRRRTIFAAVGGIAAAAAVALGISFGMTRLDSDAAPAASSAEMAPSRAESPVMAAADRAQVPASAPPSAAPAPYPWEPTAEAAVEPEAELPAAAVADPWASHAPADPDLAAEPTATSAPHAPARSSGSRAASRRRSGAGRSGLARGGSGGGAYPSAVTPGPSVPRADGEPSRAEVVNALRPFEVEIQRCAGDRREVARVSLTVDGPTGRVRSVAVGSPFTGTPAEACMRGVLSRVRLPRSASATYALSHPFRPAPIAGGTVSGPAAARARQRRAPALLDETAEPAFAR